MLISICVRFVLLLAMLVASLPVAAETRYWIFSGLQFADYAIASGYLSYDDATQTITDWNVRVGMGVWPIPGFTYVPGNSEVFQDRWDSGSWIGIASARGALYRKPGSYRVLSFVLENPLDASDTLVPIVVPPTEYHYGEEGFNDWLFCGCVALGPERKIIAGSLMVTSPPPPADVVQVDEFYHPDRRHYFITADPAEKEILDSGVDPGWVRTRESFKAYAPGSSAGGSINPVCRYYGNGSEPGGPASHFYSADVLECLDVHIQRFDFDRYRRHWLYESDNVFQIDLPDMATGGCPDGTDPVYRLWNRQGDASRRYTTSAAIKALMIAEGYVAEGYGPDGVVMCAVQ